MSKVKNNGDGESIYPFIPFSSFENSSISSSFSLIFNNENGGPIDEELEIDDPFFFYDPNNSPIFHDQGVIISENPFIQLEEGAKHGETRNHDEVLLLPTLPNTSALLNQRMLVESGSNLLDTATQLAFLTPCSSYEPKEPETLKKEAMEKFYDMDRILVDTAAPFESVREAVSKFGGIVDCKAEERLSIEKQKQIQLELKKVQEEVLKHRKRFHDEEAAKAQVLEELDRCKGLVEETNLRLEREATLEKQAKQDCELADMRLREVEQGISDDSSVASKVQLDVANERHASAVVELKSVIEEFESIQTASALLLRERDVAIEKAAASFAAFKEIKHTVQNLALKLIITKQLLESVRVVRFKAEDQTLIAALELEIEKLVQDKLLKHAEEELQQVAEQILMTNAMKLELDRTSTLLADLKAELALQNQAVSVAHTEGFEEARNYIEKSNQGVNCKDQLPSLSSELEREKASLSSMREREDLTSASIASLEAELNRMNTELELVHKRKGAGDKMAGERQAKLLQIAKEAEEAKFLTNLEREELRKAEEEIARAKIEATAMESRLQATLNEIEAAKKVNAWDESGVDFFSNAVTLTLEEYNGLSEKAKEIEKQAKERTIAATEQMETAKECETRSLEKLGEARKALEEKKKKLREAMAMAEKVEEERLLMEHELKTYKEKHRHEPTTRFGRFDGGSVELAAAGETTSSFDKADAGSQYESSTRCTGGLGVHSDYKIVPKPKQRKRMFFARILMFLARKKVQSLK